MWHNSIGSSFFLSFGHFSLSTVECTKPLSRLIFSRIQQLRLSLLLSTMMNHSTSLSVALIDQEWLRPSLSGSCWLMESKGKFCLLWFWIQFMDALCWFLNGDSVSCDFDDLFVCCVGFWLIFQLNNFDLFVVLVYVYSFNCLLIMSLMLVSVWWLIYKP